MSEIETFTIHLVGSRNALLAVLRGMLVESEFWRTDEWLSMEITTVADEPELGRLDGVLQTNQVRGLHEGFDARLT